MLAMVGVSALMAALIGLGIVSFVEVARQERRQARTQGSADARRG